MCLDFDCESSQGHVLMVFDWAEGKDRNLRALLCSLPTILWDGVRWNHVGMADLITRDQVKRQYRNAARAVHPDKVSLLEHNFYTL
ncbi:unnamed protein product [Trichobilharzia regenti]|nr:unnamed protein product [Trichobilharzia regenti]